MLDSNVALPLSEEGARNSLNGVKHFGGSQCRTPNKSRVSNGYHPNIKGFESPPGVNRVTPGSSMHVSPSDTEMETPPDVMSPAPMSTGSNKNESAGPSPGIIKANGSHAIGEQLEAGHQPKRNISLILNKKPKPTMASVVRKSEKARAKQQQQNAQAAAVAKTPSRSPILRKRPDSPSPPSSAQPMLPITPVHKIKKRTSSIPLHTVKKISFKTPTMQYPKSKLNPEAKAFDPGCGRGNGDGIDCSRDASREHSTEDLLRTQPKMRPPPGFRNYDSYYNGHEIQALDWSDPPCYPRNKVMNDAPDVPLFAGKRDRSGSGSDRSGSGGINPEAPPYRPRTKYVLTPTNGSFEEMSSNGKKVLPNTRCYHCGLVGHMALDCPKKAQGIDAICFSCGKPGHKAQDCPKVVPKDEGGPKPSPPGPKSPPATTTNTRENNERRVFPVTRKPTSIPMTSERNRKERMNKRMANKSNGKKDDSGTTVKSRWATKERSRPLPMTRKRNDKETYVAPHVRSRRASRSPPVPSVWSRNLNNKQDSGEEPKPAQPVCSILGFLNSTTGSPAETDESVVMTTPSPTICPNVPGTANPPTWPDAKFDLKEEMMPMDIAIQKVLSSCQAGEKVDLPLTATTAHQAVGFVVAEDVFVKRSLPPFAASIMDGAAVSLSNVNSVNGFCEFTHVGNVVAGDSPGALELRPGQAAYVTTGSPVPIGTHCVVPIEQITRHGSILKADAAACVRGRYIRPVGSDLLAGDLVMKAGNKLSAIDLNLMISAGTHRIKVYRKPRVVIFSTGNELISVGSEPRVGSIFDCNAPTLASLAKREGCDVVAIEMLPDSHAAIAAKFDIALKGCDLILCTGGVSRGATDHTKKVIAERGSIHFSYLKMKPGKPTTFATVQASPDAKKKYIFGLPGNPCSATVCFELLVKPAIRSISGSNKIQDTVFEVPLGMDINLDPVRPEYHRAYLAMDPKTGSFAAYSTGVQRSSRARSMQSAQLLLHLPNAVPGQTKFSRGTVVRAQAFGTPLDPLALISLPSIRSNKVETDSPPGIPKPRATDITFGILNIGAGSRSQLVMSEMKRSVTGRTIGFRSRDIPLDEVMVKSSLEHLINSECDVVVTVGGSGFKTIDCVPRLTKEICKDQIPNLFVHLLKRYSGPDAHVMSFRGTAGICVKNEKKSLIINLPSEERFLTFFLERLQVSMPRLLQMLN